MNGAGATLIAVASTWALVTIGLLYRIGTFVGDISARLNEIERRATAWDEALANGYRPRPPERRN